MATEKADRPIQVNKESMDVESYKVFGPKVFASIESLRETTEDRAIVFHMQSKTRKIPLNIDEKRHVRSEVSSSNIDSVTIIVKQMKEMSLWR